MTQTPQSTRPDVISLADEERVNDSLAIIQAHHATWLRAQPAGNK